MSAHAKTTTGGAVSHWTSTQTPIPVTPMLAHGSLAVITSAALPLATNVYTRPRTGPAVSQHQELKHKVGQEWSHRAALHINSAPLANVRGALCVLQHHPVAVLHHPWRYVAVTLWQLVLTSKSSSGASTGLVTMW
jgi:hypothetical protein